MINLPAAPAAPAPTATGDAGLPPPAANAGGASAAPAAAAAGTAAASAHGAAMLDAAAALVPAPFGALLDAMAATAAAREEGAAGQDEDSSDAGAASADSTASADSAAAAAQAVATLLPAMGSLPLPGLAGAMPGATPGSVAAVAAALTAQAGVPAPADNALLRQQAQAQALAGRETATAEPAAKAADAARAATDTSVLDPRAALLAAAARPAAALPATSAAPAAGSAARSGASDVLSAALGALAGQAGDGTAAPIAAKDGASLLADSQRQNADGSALPGFRSVLANTAASQGGDTLRLNGSPEQWQQPLRAALGDRLQLQLARNDERAVIRLEPPNMGSVEISVRHSGGALQVNIAASHSEVLRQLNTIGDAVRQDLSQRQFSEVAVTVSASGARNLAEGGGQQRQQQQETARQPGRALDDDDTSSSTFAILSERE